MATKLASMKWIQTSKHQSTKPTPPPKEKKDLNNTLYSNTTTGG